MREERRACRLGDAGDDVSTADDLLSFMEHRHWVPAILAGEQYVLEVNNVHGRIDVGFVLWRRLPNGEPELITSGHSANGRLWGGQNQPMRLSDELQQAISSLLRSGTHAA
ncbi:MAG TPA: hypothetical protein VFI42_11720 [Thermomicrobiaceae bacterium]|nr:hypothetical protein [Thermomicrobiaceae bacterium]